MNEFWMKVEPMILNALAILLPIAVGTAAGWLRHRARLWGTVEGAVREAEHHSSSRPAPLAGYEKRSMALDIIRTQRPRLTEERASQMIEAVLPKVRRESQPPHPETCVCSTCLPRTPRVG